MSTHQVLTASGMFLWFYCCPDCCKMQRELIWHFCQKCFNSPGWSYYLVVYAKYRCFRGKYSACHWWRRTKSIHKEIPQLCGTTRVWLKEHGISSVNSTANLSTLRHLTNHSMISEPGVNRWNGGSVKAFLQVPPPFPLPSSMCGPLHSPSFFGSFNWFFAFFPHWRAWSQARGS